MMAAKLKPDTAAVRDTAGMLKRNRPLLLIIGVTLLLLLTMAGLFTVPSVAAFGAFTTLIIGIAAQQSLGNVFAGVLLALSHPFVVGDVVSLNGGMSIKKSEQIVGPVKAVGIVYTQVLMDDGDVAYLPNSQMITSAVVVTTRKSLRES